MNKLIVVAVLILAVADAGRLFRRKHIHLHGHHDASFGIGVGLDSGCTDGCGRDTSIIVERPVVSSGCEYESGCGDNVHVVHKKVIVEKPVVVERPVVVEKRVVVEKPVVVERPVIYEKPVIVERPVIKKTVFYEEEQCPVEEDTCTCVPREACARGYISDDGGAGILRRGKRTLGLRIGGGIGGIIGGITGSVGLGRGCYSGCGGGYGGYGSGFFGISLGVPRIDVGYEKSYETGCTDRRRCGPSIHVVRERGCRGNCGSRGITVVKEVRPVIHKEVHITTNVKKDGDFVACENCGGANKPRKETPQPTITESRRDICSSGEVCCRTRPNGRVPAPGGCGKRNACGVDRRTGSRTKQDESDFGEYPWTAMILRFDSSGRREFLCNGVLIDSKRVLTVAQCVSEYERYFQNIEVRLGEWDVSSDVEVYPHISYELRSIDINREYNNNTLANDLAILTLTQSVENEPHVSPVCLPPAQEKFAYGSCVVTGWGNRNPIQKESPVECIDDEDCEAKLRSTKLGPNYKLHHGFLCAQTKNGESCRIDGGGPLVCKRRDGSYALIGLVSWAVDCDNPNIPEAYVRVQNYLSWINGGDRRRTVTTVTKVTKQQGQQDYDD